MDAPIALAKGTPMTNRKGIKIENMIAGQPTTRNITIINQNGDEKAIKP
jgi:hypothetical protein